MGKPGKSHDDVTVERDHDLSPMYITYHQAHYVNKVSRLVNTTLEVYLSFGSLTPTRVRAKIALRMKS